MTELTDHEVILIQLAVTYPRYANLIDRATCTWTAKWLGPWRVGVDPLLFGRARLLVDDGRGYGIADAWHYRSVAEAFAAAEAWAGPYPDTEPQGWHRNPSTGRRRDGTGREWIQW